MGGVRGRTHPPVKPLGILGGTFDPVHHGHLRLALEAQAALGLSGVRLIPARRQPLREETMASPARRLEMLTLAIEGESALTTDDRELRREGPSYTIDTLTSLREELPRVPLCLLMGGDSWEGLERWHRWRELIDLAHLVVVHRPGYPGVSAARCRQRFDREPAAGPGALAATPAGEVLALALPPLAISATRIRTLLREGGNPRYLLPDPVLQYIRNHRLYT
ncbi:MAG: nicotinate-nucleotide adenylyltransferase [Gammaproteobacteria bacterium]|nr:MAG: nicotinate-nucleotide adenylyltransferase [Gammaproteobacteria bacterium]